MSEEQAGKARPSISDGRHPARTRARELLPSVLLTVLGIVQALALELLWEGRPERLLAWRAIDAAATGWILHGTLFLGVVLVWVQFAVTVMRITWTPSLFDLVVPFVIGVMEFTLVATMVPEAVHWWFMGMAAVSVVTASVNFSIFARALTEAGRVLEAGSQRGYAPILIGSVALLIFAGWSRIAGPASAVPQVGASVAAVMLIVQLGVFRHFWNVDLFVEDGE